MKRNICVVTGTRSEYGILKSVMKEIEENSNLKLSLVATGMHLLEEFGSTFHEIENDGFKIDEKVLMYKNKILRKSDIPKALGRGISNISKAINKINPDIVLILGDRAEALAAAIATTYLRIPIAHIHGGDQSEDGAHIDDIIRPVITKLSHIHFPATEKSAERIRKIGEDNERIFLTGSPELDNIKDNLMSKEQIEKKFDIDLSKPLFIVLQHSMPTQSNEAGKQMEETMEAIIALGNQTIVLYPNNDPGSDKIISVIKKYEKFPFIKIYKNLARNVYLSILNVADVMIGNSSSGTVEAPSFELPVVNTGVRESKRESSTNKIYVNHDRDEIKSAIIKAMSKEFKDNIKGCINPYGNGNASKRIVMILSDIKINNKLMRKMVK